MGGSRDYIYQIVGNISIQESGLHFLAITTTLGAPHIFII